jgi:oligopeptide/dipeptide ABC transporter ATP-binding protein
MTGVEVASGSVPDPVESNSVETPLLELDDLVVELSVNGLPRRVLHGVSLALRAGEAIGLVGESGSGKSMTARAIDRILPPGATMTGRITFAGQDVIALRDAELRKFHMDVAMIFQDPLVHTNPVRRIGDFMTESLRTNRGVPSREAAERAVDLLSRVGIEDGRRRLRQYPHELSGGLLQRVMIATALLTAPRLLLADEPTTALDVTTQSEVMAILDELRRNEGLALLFITHDLELAAAVCDTTAVMYAGQIVEIRDSSLLHDDPLHPYTAALAAARPRIENTAHRLSAIAGPPLPATDAPTDGCPFAPRCPYAQPRCLRESPRPLEIDGGKTRCLRANELRGKLTPKAA